MIITKISESLIIMYIHVNSFFDMLLYTSLYMYVAASYACICIHVCTFSGPGVAVFLYGNVEEGKSYLTIMDSP